MSFNISEFSANVNRLGLAKNNLFFMRLNVPSGSTIAQDSDVTATDLQFLARSVDLPELSVETTGVARQGYGRLESAPNNVSFGPINAIFMVDSNFGVTKFFHRWMQHVVNFNARPGYEKELATNAALPYEIGYKNDYALSADIVVYSYNTYDVRYMYHFDNIYPVNIGNPSLAWENQTDILTLPVSFAYDHYYADGVGQSKKTSRRPGTDGTYIARQTRGFGGGMTDFIYSINNLGAGLSGLGVDNNLQDFVDDFTQVTGSVFSKTNKITSVLKGTFF